MKRLLLLKYPPIPRALYLSLITDTEVDIRHQTLVHTLLHIEVEHGLFLTIINTRYLREITLLIVGLDLIDDAGEAGS